MEIFCVPELYKLFITDQFHEFDQLPLRQQAWRVEKLHLEYKLLSKRYQKNCGKKGGAPYKWSNEMLEKAYSRTQAIMLTPEYKKRRRSNDKGMMAYTILVEELFADPEIYGMIDSRKKRNPELWPDEVRGAAKAIKVQVDRYNKKRSRT